MRRTCSTANRMATSRTSTLQVSEVARLQSRRRMSRGGMLRPSDVVTARLSACRKERVPSAEMQIQAVRLGAPGG